MSVNKVILVGRLGRDPEVRYMPNGEAVANFSLATSEQWKDKSGAKQEKTEWHNITMYRRLAEIAGDYLKKGQEVYIEGKIQSRKYTGKDGIERVAYDIIASEMKMIGGKGDSNAGEQVQDTESAPQPVKREQASPKPQVDDLDDDVPF